MIYCCWCFFVFWSSSAAFSGFGAASRSSSRARFLLMLCSGLCGSLCFVFCVLIGLSVCSLFVVLIVVLDWVFVFVVRVDRRFSLGEFKLLIYYLLYMLMLCLCFCLCVMLMMCVCLLL